VWFPVPGEPDWSRLRAGAAAFGVTLDDGQIESLQEYLRLLGEWNRRFNLTSVRDPQEILIRHFLDSLTCAAVVELPARRLVDVGSGAGFPGLVLKIAFPDLEVTLLDSQAKRLRFVERVASALGLEGVATIHARAEDAAAAAPCGPAPPVPLRERFEVVTARAVAPLNILWEWTLPFSRIGGTVVAMKGPAAAAEVARGEAALRRLGGALREVREFRLPGADAGRSLVVAEKTRPTPGAFPRPPGTARRNPL